MRNKVVAGNWKMNFTYDESIKFINEFVELYKVKPSQNPKVILIPPFTHLNLFHTLLKDTGIFLGAQNIYEKEKGAFTGELSAEIIKSFGAEYVFIGHSERRRYFQEDSKTLENKIKLSLINNLFPIYCCGENLEQREQCKQFEIIESQIKEVLFNLTNEKISKIIIAYEPVWAIGTGLNATPGQAQEVHNFIRQLLLSRYGKDISSNTTILYGGSLKANNAKELFAEKDIDGGLVGGASLIVEDFYNIINSF